MKVLIISDSHGLDKELFKVLDRHKHEVDAIIHCGDSELPKKAFSEYEKLLIVEGNCDDDDAYEREIYYDLKPIKVFITHGHLYNVKFSAVNLSYRAEELGANLVCFGHTHIATAFQENNVVYINPGSFRLPKERNERSYVIVNYQNNCEIKVIFFDQKGNEIEDLNESFLLV
ncbi:metallophosphoesterase [Bacillaceae bacterium IKA-2]|jgi:putative phosphoesterase|nr:metallophosphoesterase [Bacillaceae bacterium IKA-2]